MSILYFEELISMKVDFDKKQASRFLLMMKIDSSFSKVQFVKMDFKTIRRIQVLIKK